MFGKPGAPHWDMHFGTDLYYRADKLNRVALYVRQNGPVYLRSLTIGDIWGMLQDFISNNYWYLANDISLKRFDGSYAEHVSAATKKKLADALAVSKIFQPSIHLTVFPLVPVQVDADFDSEPFFFISPKSLDESRLPTEIDCRHFKPANFPPIAKWEGRIEQPNSWLGVRSPAIQASRKMKAAILGALALTPLPRYRHQFSGRRLFGGECTVTDGAKFSFGEPHTPPLMHDIILDKRDHGWLQILALKLSENNRATRREIKALEYFYRAWELDPSERFPVLCMALDAVFGDANHATQAVIDGIRRMLGPHIPDARVRLLMDLRAAVIHGGAPDVYDSRKYGRYYDKYGADPIHDLELIVAKCLQQQIFSGELKEHPDPNAKLIAEAQATGRLPKKISRRSILDNFSTRDEP